MLTCAYPCLSVVLVVCVQAAPSYLVGATVSVHGVRAGSVIVDYSVSPPPGVTLERCAAAADAALTDAASGSTGVRRTGAQREGRYEPHAVRARVATREGPR